MLHICGRFDKKKEKEQVHRSPRRRGFLSLSDLGGAVVRCHFRASSRYQRQLTSPAEEEKKRKFGSIDASRGEDGGVCHGGRGAVVRPAGPGAR